MLEIILLYKMLPLTNIKLCDIISQKQKNSSHLKKPNFIQFIKVCETHQQIITSFSSARNCKKTCLVCSNSNCQKHRNQQTKTLQKHNFMDLKSFSNLIKEIKDKYSEYHHIYIKEIIPVFLKNLKIVILDLFKGLERWNEETVLLQNFMQAHRSSNKKIFNLLSNDMEDWELSQFSCSDLWELISIKQRASTKSVQQMKENILDDMKNWLGKSLTFYGLIPKPQVKQQRQELIIQGNVEQMITKLKQLQTKNQAQLKNSKLSETLIIQLTQNNKKYERSLTNILSNNGADCGEQQQNQKLGIMAQQLFKYLQTCKHKTAKLTFSVEEDNVEFWEYLVDKLVELERDRIGDRKSKIEEIWIYANHHCELSEMFQNSMSKWSSTTNNTQAQPKPGIKDRYNDKPIEIKLKNFNIKFCSPKYTKLNNF